MSEFPRTMVGGVSMPRMVIGTNWFRGYSHCTKAKSEFITEFHSDYRSIADVIEVFLRSGVDAIIGNVEDRIMVDAIGEAENRTGRSCVVISTPHFPLDADTARNGLDMDAVRKILDAQKAGGATFILPHTSTTDRLVDSLTREIRFMDEICAAIREREMIPGLSTHLPEAIVFADERDLDVETYISIFNSMGFLMPIEVDWVHRLIHRAKKPALCIKPMAAGQLRPLQGLTFVLNSIRERDMMAVGAFTAREAEELVELATGILERRGAEIELQSTRSKAVVQSAAGG